MKPAVARAEQALSEPARRLRRQLNRGVATQRINLAIYPAWFAHALWSGGITVLVPALPIVLLLGGAILFASRRARREGNRPPNAEPAAVEATVRLDAHPPDAAWPGTTAALPVGSGSFQTTTGWLTATGDGFRVSEFLRRRGPTWRTFWLRWADVAGITVHDTWSAEVVVDVRRRDGAVLALAMPGSAAAGLVALHAPSSPAARPPGGAGPTARRRRRGGGPG